jgi:hypothetical protein
VRMLHAVSREETLVYQGEYHYLRDGEPTGQVEYWQVTVLPDGTEIVRADVDGRQTDGVSLVTHFHRRPDGNPDWLRLRYMTTDGVDAAAQYTFEDALIRVARQAKGYSRHLEKVEIAAHYGIDYHPMIAHEYVWRAFRTVAEEGTSRMLPIFSPDLWASGEDVLRGRSLRFEVRPLGLDTCTVPAGMFDEAYLFAITLSDGVKAEAWYDARGVPLRWYYEDKGFEFILAACTG